MPAVRCVKCGAQTYAPTSLAGESWRCRKCGASTIIPGGSPKAAASISALANTPVESCITMRPVATPTFSCDEESLDSSAEEASEQAESEPQRRFVIPYWLQGLWFDHPVVGRLACILCLGLAVLWLVPPLFAYSPPVLPGNLVSDPPRQGFMLDRKLKAPPGYTIVALESFDITAMVLGKKDYVGRTSGAAISPCDLVMGWGPMSNPDILRHMSIRQWDRWYTYLLFDSGAKLIAHRDIQRCSANVHIVPENPAVADTIRGISPREVWQLKGYLVEIQHDSGWSWTSSLTRDDTGAGACELMFVTSAMRVQRRRGDGRYRRNRARKDVRIDRRSGSRDSSLLT